MRTHRPKRSPDHISRYGRGYGKRPPGLPPQVPLRIERESLAWAAGLFVGEGCVTVSADGRYRQLILTVTQAGGVEHPPDILVRFRSAIGDMGAVDGPRIDPTGVRLPKWRFRVTGFEVTQAIIALLWPWLGEVKKAQAGRAFETFRSRPAGVRRAGNRYGRPLNARCVRGHDYTDAYVDPTGVRHCRPCMRLRGREGQRHRRRVRKLMSLTQASQ